MSERIKAIVESVRKGLNQLGNRVGSGVQGVAANPSLRQHVAPRDKLPTVGAING